MPPTLANGKICYIEMPATDIVRSAEFFKQVFGWNIRTRGDGSVAFDDTVQRSERHMGDPTSPTGARSCQPIGGDAPEITARSAVREET